MTKAEQVRYGSLKAPDILRATSILEWDIVIGGRRAATLRMELGGPAEIVQRGYLARLGCVAEVVR